MKLLSIRPSTLKGKRLTAIFLDVKTKKEIIKHFGQEGGSTFIDHKDEQKRQAYIKRHQPNEDWTNPLSSGALSRFLLWEKPTLFQAIKFYKEKFNL